MVRIEGDVDAEVSDPVGISTQEGLPLSSTYAGLVGLELEEVVLPPAHFTISNNTQRGLDLPQANPYQSVSELRCPQVQGL